MIFIAAIIGLGDDNMEEEKIALTAGATNGSYNSSFLGNQEEYVAEDYRENETYLMEERKSVIILVYEDQFGQKYLDEYTLATLAGVTKYTEYKYADGSSMTVSDYILLHKKNAVPEGYESATRRFHDFSEDYPFNSQLELYVVTDEQLAELIANFKRSKPDLDVTTEIREVELKTINEENNDKGYSELARMINEPGEKNNNNYNSVKFNK